MITIHIIPNTAEIPDLLEMETDMPEGHTSCFVCDSNNTVYWFTKKDGEIISSNYFEDYSLTEMLDLHFGIFE